MKRKVVLSESKFRGLVKNIITEILVKKAYSKFYSDIPEDEYNKIADADKTRGNHLGAYAKWLLELYKQNKFNLSDINKAKKYISVFDRMAQAGQLKGVDINTFDSIDDMYELVKDNLDSDVITKGDRIRKEKETGVERIYEDSDWLVISPKTHEASCRYGANTKWCTTEKDDDSQFKDYISEGPLYTLINKKTNEKYQLHFERNEYRNAENKMIKLSSLNLPEGMINAITKGDFRKSVRFKYDNVLRVKENVAIVMLNDKYNLVKKNGELIFEEWGDVVFIDDFEYGFASVGLDGKFNLINKDGEMMFPNQWFGFIYSFKDGFAKVSGLDDKYNLINKNGEMVFPNQWFDWIDSFEDGFATVNVYDKGWNYINKNGEIVFPNQWFDWIDSFEDGFARVRINNKQNIINQNGELISDQWFDWIYDIEGGIGSVEINGKMYKINLNNGSIK